jgi:hypothetical protein
MRLPFVFLTVLGVLPSLSSTGQPPDGQSLVARPDAFPTLVNPACSHCRDEAKRRAGELKDGDRVLCWTRGYSEGGAIPFRFFLNQYRVISDSYGVFVHDADAGFARGFAPSYDFRFHGWRHGVMVMRHKDGTLYSCLTGVAFDGPRKGDRLKIIPTLVSDWGFWLEKYPQAVAYHMFEKYQPVDAPTKANSDALKSRSKPDPRLPAENQVLGVWAGKDTRAYPVAALVKVGFIRDVLSGESVVVLWEPRTRTAAAYRPVASQPRKYKGPRPDSSGVSPADEGVPLPAGAPVQDSLKITVGPSRAAGQFVDEETHSTWDVAGRCVEGKLKGWTMEWVDSVQVKWYAWAAENPRTTIYDPQKTAPADTNKKVREIAGTAEFLRLLPKPFATLRAVDPKKRTVTLLMEGEHDAKVWPVEPDAEIKVSGWWGRLSQFREGQRVWVWLKLNRKKQPVSVVMLADELSEWDLHSSLRKKKMKTPQFAPEDVEAKRAVQKTWLREKWAADGLPGTLAMHHVFSGELEIALDHEAMRWGRSLAPGDEVTLTADPTIKGVVKSVVPWRERTIVRLVVGELESSELKAGQRLGLKMMPPKAEDDGQYPSDIDRPRTKAERVEWFLASVYCSCGVGKDTCTGHFYTLASCNPNGCGHPNHTRERVVRMIEKGLSDRQIFDALRKEDGPLMLRPHLRP